MTSSDDERLQAIEKRIARFHGPISFAALPGMRVNFLLHLVTEEQHAMAEDTVVAIAEKYNLSPPDVEALFNAFAYKMHFLMSRSIANVDTNEENLPRVKWQ